MPEPHYLELNGAAYQRGRIHGGELQQQVNDCVDFYRELFGYGERELAQRSAVFERLIDAYAPRQAEEIRGIAAGAGLPEAHIFAINARSELVPIEAAECTVLCAPQAGLLGQTWDWCQRLEDLVTLLSITLESGHRILTVSEPGIVGKIGLSSAGIGVCLNFLLAPRSVDGVPVHTMLREVLEADSLATAQQRLRQSGTGHAGNIMLAAASGEAVNFEFAGDHVDERQLQESFAHTNHCLFRQLPAGEFEENSRGRLQRAGTLLVESPGPTMRDFVDILSDRQDPDASIWVPYQPFYGLELGTLCTVVMDLSRGEMHLRMGQDAAADFEIYRV